MSRPSRNIEFYAQAVICLRLKNNSDYRESLAVLCGTMKPDFPFLDLLQTLCEIQEIIHSDESNRTGLSI